MHGASLPRRATPLFAGQCWRRQQQAAQYRHSQRRASRAGPVAQHGTEQPAGAARRALWLAPVWPERSSSAAGVRTADLVAALRAWGWSLAFLSPATPNEHSEHLQAAGCEVISCPLNREAALTAHLQRLDPQLAVFDRFYAEEAFSFRVRQVAPAALRVLDMQDFHALRDGRQQMARSGTALAQVVAHRPDASSPGLLRELAAIHRSDMTLVCSPVEGALLQNQYGVPPDKLCPAPFFAQRPHASGLPGFSPRRHFMAIGNFKHPPNLDAAKWLVDEVWGRMRALLGDASAELHLYGSYPSGAAQQLHQPARGIHMKGHAPSLDIMRSYRVSLAPLRFGAGLKGKIVDSWAHGLPVCTTPIGAEGMFAPAGLPSLDSCRAATATASPAGSSNGGAGTAASCYSNGGTSSQPGEQPVGWWGSGLGPHVKDLAAGDAARGQPADQPGPSAPGAGLEAHPLPPGGAGWGGLWTALDAQHFASDAARLYQDEALWRQSQAAGLRLLGELYDRDATLAVVRRRLEAALAQREARRAGDHTGQMLWSQQMRATEYFSRWIEAKELAKQLQDDAGL